MNLKISSSLRMALGKYMVGKDAGATANGGWILLYFKEVEKESAIDGIRVEIEQLPITDTAIRLVTEILDKYKIVSEE